MSVPFYCKPCGETLTEEQAECPFCMNPATPLDECVSVSAAWHKPDCEWHHEQVAAECTCPTIGARLRKAAQELRTHPYESATMAEAKIMAARILADVADEVSGETADATEAEADKAIEVLERAIEAARNSNQAGENAVVRAARAISPAHPLSSDPEKGE